MGSTLAASVETVERYRSALFRRSPLYPEDEEFHVYERELKSDLFLAVTRYEKS